MNRAYLRPPLPLYRVAALLTLPLIFWLAVHVGIGRLGPLQRLYWSDYLQTSVLPPIDLNSLLLSFGQGGTPKHQFKLLVCSGPFGRERPVTVDGKGIPLDSRLAVVSMTDQQYNPWLSRSIYGGRPAVGFLVLPIFFGLLAVALLGGSAYVLD